MMPQRFVVDYPRRCLTILDAMERYARSMNLLVSFSLIMASPLFLIPYERMKSKHPLRDREIEPELHKRLKRLGKQRFMGAEIWKTEPPIDWRFSRIVNDPNKPRKWCDENGAHPSSEQTNTIDRRDFDDVARVIRNALAHGNIVYLNEQWGEEENRPIGWLAFISRYEETSDEREAAETYRVVAAKPDEFLRFVRLWAEWLEKQWPEQELRAAS